MIGRGQQRPV